uniref:Uncharacterized protein n=1 Tax=viral metagenome TaxID=1070528 RepID=A0A6M3LQM1_9ZZZZ
MLKILKKRSFYLQKTYMIVAMETNFIPTGWLDAISYDSEDRTCKEILEGL